MVSSGMNRRTRSSLVLSADADCLPAYVEEPANCRQHSTGWTALTEPSLPSGVVLDSGRGGLTRPSIGGETDRLYLDDGGRQRGGGLRALGAARAGVRQASAGTNL